MTPSFDADVEEYTATTTNASDKVTATATDEGATVTITLGTTPVENGSDVTWTEGENVLTIVVSELGASTTYTVTVTVGEQ